MDQAIVNAWGIVTQHIVMCSSCGRLCRSHEAGATQEQVIKECIAWGWILDEDGPKCFECVLEDEIAADPRGGREK